MHLSLAIIWCYKSISDLLQMLFYQHLIILHGGQEERSSRWDKNQFLIDTEMLLIWSRLIWVLNYQQFCVLIHNALCKWLLYKHLNHICANCGLQRWKISLPRHLFRYFGKWTDTFCFFFKRAALMTRIFKWNQNFWLCFWNNLYAYSYSLWDNINCL